MLGSATSDELRTQACPMRRRSERSAPLARCEGILPALESSHALAHACRLAREGGPEQILLVNLSGRGDKDVETVREYMDNNDADR